MKKNNSEKQVIIEELRKKATEVRELKKERRQKRPIVEYSQANGHVF